MIDFACRRFNLDEVIRCSLNLSKKEYGILEYFIKNSNKRFTPLEISNKFKIGLSTSQRAIKKMYDKELLTRTQKNLNKGGYIFVYSVKEKLLLKEKILDIIHNWIKNVEENIKNW